MGDDVIKEYSSSELSSNASSVVDDIMVEIVNLEPRNMDRRGSTRFDKFGNSLSFNNNQATDKNKSKS